MVEMVKLEIFIPPETLPRLQEALASAGAGRIGNYDHCLSYSQVVGIWRPLEGANPTSGLIGQVNQANEFKVEVNCSTDLLPQVLHAIRQIHPYEEPVINIISLISFESKEETDP
jgi:hypothetical protein